MNGGVPTTRTIGLLVVSQVRLYREGLAQVLGAEPGLRVVGSAASIAEIPGLAGRLEADVVLLDIAMPTGIAAARACRLAVPRARLVCLAVPEVEDDVIARAEAGMAAYVTRDASLRDLVATIHGVVRDEAFCGPRITSALLRRVASLAADRPVVAGDAHLTARERQVLELVGRGYSNKQIARRLSIEVATVKNHVHHILEKLQVARRDEAVARLRRLEPAGEI